MAETKINANQTTITASDIGAARATTVLPTASVSEVDKIYQFTGTTDANYTNGYFYKCVSDGQSPATYSWERVDVQPSSGLTYTAGTGINIDSNNEISVVDPVLVNNQTGTSSVNIKGTNNNSSNAVAVGSSAYITNNQGVAVGWSSQAGYDCTAVGARSLAYDDYSIAIGFGATVPNGVDYSIQIGNGTNNTSGTMAVALSTDGSSWTNYELLSANGTIPEARLADTTNAQQGDVLTLDANGDAVWQAGGSGLPSQTGSAGKFLTTDGTNASWGSALVNKSPVSGALTILGSNTSTQFATAIGVLTSAGMYSTAVGYWATATGNNSTALGHANAGSSYSIALGSGSGTSAIGAIQLGYGTNSTTGTFSVGLSKVNSSDPYAYDHVNYEILSWDGTIPADRLKNAINKYSTMPTAASTNEGWIVQFTGTTDANYTHGYIYECKAQGTNPETYAWEQIDVQPAGSYITNNADQPANGVSILGGASYGYGVSIGLGTFAYSASVAIGYNAQSQFGVAIGANSTADDACISIGSNTSTSSASYSIAIGYRNSVSANCAVQLGSKGVSNSGWDNADANTFKVGNANGNYEMMSADGTIPTARLTKVNTTITLTTAGWSSNTQTVNITGMTATGVVFVSPDPTDQADYTSAGILCTAQAAGTLTFTCDSVPSGDIDVNVVML